VNHIIGRVTFGDVTVYYSDHCSSGDFKVNKRDHSKGYYLWHRVAQDFVRYSRFNTTWIKSVRFLIDNESDWERQKELNFYTDPLDKQFLVPRAVITHIHIDPDIVCEEYTKNRAFNLKYYPHPKPKIINIKDRAHIFYHPTCLVEKDQYILQTSTESNFSGEINRVQSTYDQLKPAATAAHVLSLK
jgi:hypothetical protein